MGVASDRPDRSLIRVSIVDDDLYVRTSLASLLDGFAGLQICSTHDGGRQALAELPADPPDIVLVDITMPDLDGVGTTRELRALLPQIKVIALTSLADELSAAAMLDAGAAGFLTKDTPVGAMAHSIRAIHAGLTVLSPPAAGLLELPASDEVSAGLSELERQILKLVGLGRSNPEIGEIVFLSASAVKHHISGLAEKLGATNRVTLAIAAQKRGLL